MADAEQRIYTAEARQIAALVDAMPEDTRRALLRMMRGVAQVVSQALADGSYTAMPDKKLPPV